MVYFYLGTVVGLIFLWFFIAYDYIQDDHMTQRSSRLLFGALLVIPFWLPILVIYAIWMGVRVVGQVFKVAFFKA